MVCHVFVLHYYYDYDYQLDSYSGCRTTIALPRRRHRLLFSEKLNTDDGDPGERKNNLGSGNAAAAAASIHDATAHQPIVCLRTARAVKKRDTV